MNQNFIKSIFFKLQVHLLINIIFLKGIHGIIDIVIGNGHSNLSSNHGQGYLHYNWFS